MHEQFDIANSCRLSPAQIIPMGVPFIDPVENNADQGFEGKVDFVILPELIELACIVCKRNCLINKFAK